MDFRSDFASGVSDFASGVCHVLVVGGFNVVGVDLDQQMVCGPRETSEKLVGNTAKAAKNVAKYRHQHL